MIIRYEAFYGKGPLIDNQFGNLKGTLETRYCQKHCNLGRNIKRSLATIGPIVGETDEKRKPEISLKPLWTHAPNAQS